MPALWATEVGAWSVHLRAAGRAAGTVAVRTAHLRAAGRALGGSPWDQGTEALAGYLAGGGWARNTLRSVRASLGSFYLVDTDLPVVQALLGHASPATTLAYVAVPAEALRRTVAAVAATGVQVA